MSQVSNPVYPLIWQIHYGWLLYEQGRESIMKVSEYKVMKSPAGYYVGKEYYDDDCNGWLPYSRNSDYYSSQKEAKRLLDMIIKTLLDQN